MPVANRAHPAPDTSYASRQLNFGDPTIDPQSQLTAIDPIVAEHAEKIRCLGKRVLAHVIEIGRRLTECKKRLGHGQWGTWLDREFRWSDRQALNFMRVYELVESKSENFAELQISVSALYLLAAPSTPPEVRDEIIERAERGEKLTHAKVLERVRLSRPPSPRPAPGAAAPPPDAGAQPTPTATDATPPAKPDRRRCGFGDSTSSAVAIAKRLLVDLFAQGMKAEPKQVACALREVVPAGSPMDKLIHWLDCLLAEMRARTSEREILAPTAERSEMAGSTRAIPGKHQ